MAGLVWAGCLGFGYVRLLAYAAKPGAVGSDVVRLPESMKPLRASGRPLVVLALHPRCSCSKASADELADVLGWTPEAFDLVVLAYAPAEPQEGWPVPAAPSSLARFHPHVVSDPDGKLAESLGAATSGHVLVFDPADRLVFSGGVTPGRGHRGQTDGQRALREFLAGGAGPRSAGVKAPVFGCEIQNRPTVSAR